MEKLEIIRSVIAIFRDILLIIVFVVLIITGLTIVNFVSSIDTSKLSCEGLVSSIMSGEFDFFSETSPTTEKYEATAEMQSLMGQIEASALSGDYDTALAKLDELRSLADSAGMTEAVEKIDELKQAIEEEDFMKILSLRSQIKKMFG